MVLPGCVFVQLGPSTAYVDSVVQEKLTEEELTERMARIREQNEKIKQRRLVCLTVGYRSGHG